MLRRGPPGDNRSAPEDLDCARAAAEPAPKGECTVPTKEVPNNGTAVSRPAIELPAQVVHQDEVIAAMAAHFAGVPHLERGLELMRHTEVRTRHLLVPLDELFENRGFGERNNRYAKDVVRIGAGAATQALQHAGVRARDIDHMVFVSCTGYMLPGPDAYIAQEIGCRPDMRRTPIQQLGCAAGASALAEAHNSLRANPGSLSLVVAVELASLSFQPSCSSLSDFISAGIFSDAAGAVVLGGERRGPGLRILDTIQHLLPNSTDVIFGETSEIGFHFETNPKVRHTVQLLQPTLARFLVRQGWSAAELRFCASHTGGPLVIKAVAKALGIPEAMLAPSWESLRQIGNPSSVSVLDVLARHYASPPPDGPGLLLAFGPGFTTEALACTWDSGTGTAATAGDTGAACGSGRDPLVSLASAREGATGEPDWPRWLPAVTARYGEVEAALTLLTRAGDSAALPLAAALTPYWPAAGRAAEGYRWLRAALSVVDRCSDPPAAHHAAVLRSAADLALCLGELGDANVWLGRAAAVRRAGAFADTPDDLRLLGRLALLQGEHVRARRLLSRAIDRCAAAGDVMREAHLRLDLAGLWLDQQDPAVAADLARSALAGYWQRGDARGVARARSVLAEASAGRQDLAEGGRLALLALGALAEIGDHVSILEALEALLLCAGAVVRGTGTMSIVELAGAVRALRGSTGIRPPARRDAGIRALVDRAVPDLGRVAVDRALARGGSLTLQEASSCALDPVTFPVLGGPNDAVLSERERQVAALIAQGLTNRQISRHLQIAEWTAINHVRHLMRKLHVSSRVEVARWFLTAPPPTG
jgi:1,3,6,8-tetrahydroxynaphthalene synthase